MTYCSSTSSSLLCELLLRNIVSCCVTTAPVTGALFGRNKLLGNHGSQFTPLRRCVWISLAAHVWGPHTHLRTETTLSWQAADSSLLNKNLPTMTKQAIREIWQGTSLRYSCRLIWATVTPNGWPHFRPLFWRAPNRSPSPQRKNFPTITASTCQKPSSLISIFYTSRDSTPSTIPYAKRERTMKRASLIKAMSDLIPLLQKSLEYKRRTLTMTKEKGPLASFRECDNLHAACDHFHEEWKLCLPWLRRRRVTKCLMITSFRFQT